MSTIDLNSYISEPFKNTVKVEFPLLTKDYVSGGRITFRGYNFPIHIDTSVRQGIDSTYNLHKQHTPAWEATHTVSRNQINQIFVLNMPALEAGKEMGVTIEYLSPNGQLVPEMFLNNFTYRSELLRPVGVEIGNGDPLLELHEISANNKVKVTVELPKSVDEGQTVVVKSNTEEFSKEHIVTEEDKELGYVVFEFAAPPENEKMTAEAYLIDKLGNDSARDIGEATRNSLDEPELTLNAIAGDDLISAAEAKDDIEISGFASGNFKAGDKVIVEISADHIIETTVDENGQFAVQVPASVLINDADKHIVADLLDSKGEAIASAERTYKLSPVSPKLSIDLDVIAEDGVFSVAEAAQSHTIKGTVSGEFNAGDKVVVSFDDNIIYTRTVDANGKFEVTDVPASYFLNDADKTIKAVVTTVNALGAKGYAETTETFTFSTEAPNAQTTQLVIENITEDNIINAAEAKGTVSIKGQAIGQFKEGDQVRIFLDDNTYYTRTVDAEGKFSVSSVPASSLVADSDHKITAVLTATNVLGNKGTITAEKEYAVDTVAPNAETTHIALNNVTADNLINGAENKGNITLSGQVTGEFNAGDRVRIYLDDNTYYTRTVDANGHFAADVEASRLVADADRTFKAVLTTTDAAGNTGTIEATKDYNVDTTVEAKVDLYVSNDNFVSVKEARGKVNVYGKVTGEFNEGDQVRIFLDKKTYFTRKVDANGNFNAQIDGKYLVKDADKIASAVLTTTDAAGNTAEISTQTQYGVANTSGTGAWIMKSGGTPRLVTAPTGRTIPTGNPVEKNVVSVKQVEPIKAPETVKPTEPVKSIDSSNSTGAWIMNAGGTPRLVPTPTGRKAPAGKVAEKAVEPTKAVETVKPVEPVKPAETVKPVEPVKPIETAKPIETVKPVQPAKPIETVKPVQPAKPAEEKGAIIELRALNGDLGLYYGVSKSGSKNGSGDVSFTQAKGHDTYTTTDGNDKVFIGYTSSGNEFMPRQAGSFSNWADSNRGTAGKAVDGNLSISTLDLGKGDDLVRIRGDQNQQTRAYLGEGNDRIEVGLKVTSAVSTKSAFTYKDSAISAIFGEAGNDHIEIGGSIHNAFISGGSGSDTINIGFGKLGGGSLVGSTIIDLGSGKTMPTIYLSNYQDHSLRSLGNDNNVDARTDVNKLNIAVNVDPGATILGGNGRDIVSIGGRFNGKMELGDNNDSVTFTGGVGKIDGGRGDDTVIITGKGQTLNLSQFVRVETIDISGSGSNTLRVNAESERNTGTTVFVKGNADDKVDLGNVGRTLKETGTSKGTWAKAGMMHKDGVMYQGYEFNHQDDSVIYIQQGVQVL